MIRDLLNSRKLGFLIIAVAFALRLGWVLWDGGTYASTPDTYYYYQGALSLANGTGYVVEGQPVTHWPIGYSAFLSVFFRLFGDSLQIVFLLNVLLDTGCIFIIWLLAHRWSGKLSVANIAAALYAILPGHVLFCMWVRSELLFSVLSFAALLAITETVKSQRYILLSAVSGVLFGAACYVRPQTIILPAAFLVGIALLRRPLRWRKWLAVFAVVHVVMVLAVVPGVKRTSRVAGRFAFMSTAGDLALFHGNNPYADGTPVMGREAELVPEGMTPGEFAMAYIKEHPMHFVRLIPKKLAVSFLPTGDLPSPTDWAIIEKLPTHISSGEVERLKIKLQDRSQRLNVIMGSLEWSSSEDRYVLREGLSDSEKSRFVYYLLGAGVHDFPTPRFFVPLRYAFKYWRYVLVCILLVTVSSVLLWPRCRRTVFRNQWFVACMLVCAAQLSVFLVFAGGGRYSMPVIPLLLIFTAIFVDLLLLPPSTEEPTSP